MAEDGYRFVEPRSARTRIPGVYAVRGRGVGGRRPRPSVFAEGAARVVAAEVLAELRGEADRTDPGGLGSCYVEFGAGRVGRVDVALRSGPRPTGTFQAPSGEIVAEERGFGAEQEALAVHAR